MKTLRKTLSILLSLLIIASALSPALTVLAESSQYRLVAKLAPLGAGSYKNDSLGVPIVPETTKTSKLYSYGSNTYYTEGTDLYKIIRNKTEKRETKFDIRVVYGSMQLFGGLQRSVMRYVSNATSDALSISSTDGDYIWWHISNISFASEYAGREGDRYYYKLSLSLEYRDTAEEQKEVDKVVESFVNSVNTSGMSDYRIVKKIHDFICNKTSYDYDALKNMRTGNEDKYKYAFTSYGALVKGLSVCQGYALAFYRLCKELGYDVRFVSSDPSVGCHAWNIIKLNGKYYFVDCTWDDDEGNYNYFLVDYYELSKNDTIYQHKLYSSIYNNEYFKENCEAYFADESYNKDDAGLLTNCTVSLSSTSYTYSGNKATPSVTVKSPDGSILGKSNYTVSYSNNTQCGEGKVKIKGKNNFSESDSLRLFRIYPKKIGGFGTVSNSKTATSITLKWNKPEGTISGYDIYRKKANGKWVLAASPKSTDLKCKITGLSPSASSTFKIVAYRSVNNRKISGKTFPTITVTTPPKTPAISLTAGKKSVTVKWKKVDCSGYIIKYSTDKKFKKSKSIKAGKAATSKKITGLKKGKKYYVRTRAYYTKSGKTYYSGWSTIKSIVAK